MLPRSIALALSLMLAPLAAPIAAQEAVPPRVVLPTDRTVLPIPEPQYEHARVVTASSVLATWMELGVSGAGREQRADGKQPSESNAHA